jgi:RimJ/RimL family protein N-acetyltransferase
VSLVAGLSDYPKTVVLSDGVHLRLRPMVRTDAAALAELFARLPEEERWYLRHDVADPAVATAFAARLDPARTLPVLALDGERVVAEATLHRRGERSQRHLAEVRLTLDPGYRGRRLGTWLLLDCVHLAGALGVERLLAVVPAHEEALLAALRRLDFVHEAVLPDHHRGPDGRSSAAVVMAKGLHRAWTDF